VGLCPSKKRSLPPLDKQAGKEMEGELGNEEACERQTRFLWNARSKETTVPSACAFSFGLLLFSRVFLKVEQEEDLKWRAHWSEGKIPLSCWAR
jgi:hypothetical protein